MQKERIKLGAEALSTHLKCSVRHAMRLRASDDERCYIEVASNGGGSRVSLPPNDTKDALAEVRRIIGMCGHATLFAAALRYTAEEYRNWPVNKDEILEALGGIFKATSKIENLCGFDYPDDVDANQHDGRPTLYEQAQSGGRIYRTERKMILQWAERYNMALDCTFYGYPDGEVQFDKDDNEIPPPPDEHVIRKVK